MLRQRVNCLNQEGISFWRIYSIWAFQIEMSEKCCGRGQWKTAIVEQDFTQLIASTDKMILYFKKVFFLVPYMISAAQLVNCSRFFFLFVCSCDRPGPWAIHRPFKHLVSLLMEGASRGIAENTICPYNPFILSVKNLLLPDWQWSMHNV